jgi:protein-disulfide isomerase
MGILLYSFFSALSASRACRAVLAACAMLLLGAVAASSQANSTSLLKLPAGARVAIVEFDDLQCPSCAHANPILKEAAAKYHIPWIRHDYLIPYHNWSRNAAVYSRWFDAKNKSLGNEYRNEVFANQTDIYSPVMLNRFTQKFAQSHGIALPFAIDPQGNLMAEVNADVELGKRLGITQTPTIYILSEGPRGTSATQVKDVDSDLYRTIDQAMSQAHR